MGKIKKKGTTGASKNYLTRSQAVRKLQISLGDFRRLCIYKGIYPREPRSKKRVSKSSTPSTSFYYTKDIQYLLHEPLLAKFRDQKALAKKIARALGKNEISDAARLERTLTPRLRLDHVIKERYPTFLDALRDLDDALSLLFLFANLPSTTEVPAKTIAKCQRLTMEFEHYLIRTHSLRKSFLSIKGIYYQATIQGQDVLWLVPYKFVQRAGADVDFRIMATFVQFYAALLGFVNFRLFTGIGVVYPPRFDLEREERGAGLEAFRLEGRDVDGGVEGGGVVEEGVNERAQAEADRLLSAPADADVAQQHDSAEGLAPDDIETNNIEQPSTTQLDPFAPLDSTADNLLQPSATDDASVAGQLFEPFTFFLSRETPRHPLEFILKAFGCKRVGWETSLGEPGSYCEEGDERITHQVVDRPDVPISSLGPTNDGQREGDGMDFDDDEGGVVDGSAAVKKANMRVPGRIYVQPQWVWDSINAGQLQRVDLYAPGATLPPHLSPWVKARKGVYDPTVSLAGQEGVGEAEEAEEDEGIDAEEDGDVGEEMSGVDGDEDARVELGAEEVEVEEDGGMDVQLAASEDEDEGDGESDAAPAIDDDFAGFSDEGEEADLLDDSARQAQLELEAEALGHQVPVQPVIVSRVQKAKAQRALEARAEREEVERRKMMMPRRKRKVFEKMVYSNARRDEEAEKLRGKRRRVEREKGAG